MLALHARSNAFTVQVEMNIQTHADMIILTLNHSLLFITISITIFLISLITLTFFPSSSATIICHHSISLLVSYTVLSCCHYLISVSPSLSYMCVNIPPSTWQPSPWQHGHMLASICAAFRNRTYVLTQVSYCLCFTGRVFNHYLVLYLMHCGCKKWNRGLCNSFEFIQSVNSVKRNGNYQK